MNILSSFSFAVAFFCFGIFLNNLLYNSNPYLIIVDLFLASLNLFSGLINLDVKQ